MVLDCPVCLQRLRLRFVTKMFGTKIRYLPKRPGERYASALTNMHLSNKVYKYFGKIDLRKYIKTAAPPPTIRGIHPSAASDLPPTNARWNAFVPLCCISSNENCGFDNVIGVSATAANAADVALWVATDR